MNFQLIYSSFININNTSWSEQTPAGKKKVSELTLILGLSFPVWRRGRKAVKLLWGSLLASLILFCVCVFLNKSCFYSACCSASTDSTHTRFLNHVHEAGAPSKPRPTTSPIGCSGFLTTRKTFKFKICVLLATLHGFIEQDALAFLLKLANVQKWTHVVL